MISHFWAGALQLWRAVLHSQCICSPFSVAGFCRCCAPLQHINLWIRMCWQSVVYTRWLMIHSLLDGGWCSVQAARMKPATILSLIMDCHCLSPLLMPGLCVRRRYLLQAECVQQIAASYNHWPGAACGERALRLDLWRQDVVQPHWVSKYHPSSHVSTSGRTVTTEMVF